MEYKIPSYQVLTLSLLHFSFFFWSPYQALSSGFQITLDSWDSSYRSAANFNSETWNQVVEFLCHWRSFTPPTPSTQVHCARDDAFTLNQTVRQKILVLCGSAGRFTVWRVVFISDWGLSSKPSIQLRIGSYPEFLPLLYFYRAFLKGMSVKLPFKHHNFMGICIVICY